jgi:hypothetical protein
MKLLVILIVIIFILGFIVNKSSFQTGNQKIPVVLLISCFVTKNRSNVSAPDKADRMDIFKLCLKNLTKITWKKVILRISLDDDYKNQENDLRNYIMDLFPGADLIFKRYEMLSEWKVISKQIKEEGDPIYATTNDDHIFLDTDDTIIQEGLRLMQNNTDSVMKCMDISHWPENMIFAKNSNGKMQGNFLLWRVQPPLPDATKFFDAKTFGEMFEINNDIDIPFKRLDERRADRQFSSLVNDKEYEKRKNDIYAPLKEQFRKYNGYTHARIPDNVLSPMDQSLTTKEQHEKYMRVQDPGKSIPEEWVKQSQKLYGI